MTFADTYQLRSTLLDIAPNEFVSAHLFEPIPYLFADDASLWIRWKTELATLLEVDPYEIVLTGSGAIGFSLNPSKGFKAFRDDSDVDVAVVSAYHFDVAWRCLRRNPSEWLSLSKTMKKAIRSHKRNYVFAGTIATDRILSLLPFAMSWQRALDHMMTLEPTFGRDVNLRIYRDCESLRSYQANGIEQLRGALGNDEVDMEAIPTEEE